MTREVANAFGKVFLTMTYEPQHHLTYNVWHGYLTLESIMNGSNVGIEFLAQTRCPYLLNDNTLVTGPWNHAVAWIAQDWTPRAIAQGLRYFAHVVSPESFAALSAEALVSSVGDQFELRIFDNIVAARQWLRTCQPAAR
jgi:hypothetical protein